MMGTSLLAMPWAVAQAGLAAAPVIAIILGAIANFTAVLILKLHRRVERKYLEWSTWCLELLQKLRLGTALMLKNKAFKYQKVILKL